MCPRALLQTIIKQKEKKYSGWRSSWDGRFRSLCGNWSVRSIAAVGRGVSIYVRGWNVRFWKTSVGSIRLGTFQLLPAAIGHALASESVSSLLMDIRLHGLSRQF
jgi:hypothetical protein